jgi:hypothetical protein
MALVLMIGTPVLLSSFLISESILLYSPPSSPKFFLSNASPNGISPPDIPMVVDYEFDILFLGFNETSVDKDALVDLLPAWHAPIITEETALSGEYVYDMKYTLNYNITYAESTPVQEYRDFLLDNSVEDIAPQFIQPEHPTARYIQSSLVEEYLAQNVVHSTKPTLVIIDIYSFDTFGHKPHYYNNSYNNHDAEVNGYISNSMPWSSTYQIAGGGENHRLLWLDLSAGPTVYHHYASEAGGVEEVDPIWSYANISYPEERLTQDISEYITLAIETRFLHHTIWRPPTLYEEIIFEIAEVNLDPSFDITDTIDPEYIVSQYEKVNPFLNWSYHYADWDWQSDDEFLEVIEDSIIPNSELYNMWDIVLYLDENYQNIFTQSTNDTKVIPVILFMFQEDWDWTPSMGGMIRNLNDHEFTYLFLRLSRCNSDPDFTRTEPMEMGNLIVDVGSYLNFSGSGGEFIEKLNLIINVNNGSANVYFFDDYNYNQYRQGLEYVDLAFTPLRSISDSSGPVTLEGSMHIIGNYYLIFENNGSSILNLDVSGSITLYRCMGYTKGTMHEIGHALGLQHPHEGFTWHSNTRGDTYINWLWDMSYTQMCYSSSIPTISVIDIDTLQRGMILEYWNYGLDNVNALLAQSGLPTSVLNHIHTACDFLEESIAFYSDFSDSNHYNKSLTSAFNILTEVETASIILYSNQLIHLMITLGLSAVSIVIIGYFLLRRRKLALAVNPSISLKILV